MRVGDPCKGMPHLFSLMPKWIREDKFVYQNWGTCVFMCMTDYAQADQPRFQSAHFVLNEDGSHSSQGLSNCGRGTTGGEPVANQLDWNRTSGIVLIRAVQSHSATAGILTERTYVPVDLSCEPLADCLFHGTSLASFKNILFEDGGIMPGTPGAGGRMTHFAIFPLGAAATRTARATEWRSASATRSASVSSPSTCRHRAQRRCSLRSPALPPSSKWPS